MKLTKLVITGFRSIKQKEPLRIDEKVTILIGANDHGKTNLLEALTCLNDDRPIRDEEKNWDLKPEEIVEIEWHFDCDPTTKEKMEAWRLPEVQPVIAATVPVAVAAGVETETVSAVQATPIQVAEQPPTFLVNAENEIVYVRNGKENRVKVISVPFKIPIAQEAAILGFRPRVELFAPPTNNVKDMVNAAQLITDEYEFMQGIFRLAGIWDQKDIIFTHNDTTSKLLDKASETLTAKLRDQWNQGRDLTWRLKHTGTAGDHIVIEIQDPSIDNRYTRPSYRSSGFKTYFLLSMIISARTEKHPSNSFIYLFDEPGTYLHPHAQLDLQKSFESISDQSQLIYTTHSLFLVSKNHPARNRVVSKTTGGTRIDQKPFTKNWKAVRNSLGILLSNNFLIAEKTLLVEGPSDVIYLLDAIKKLKEKNELDIDLNDLSIVDAGDKANYVAMAKLMLSEGRSVTALVDGDDAGALIQEQLEKACAKELKDGLLQIISLPRNKSIEDICTDLAKLRQSVKNVFGNLVQANIRQPIANLNIDGEISKIVENRTITLGKTIDSVTAKWFDPEEKISKLSVAMEYESLETESSVPAAATEQLKKIQASLGVRGERPEKQIFEEVDKES